MIPNFLFASALNPIFDETPGLFFFFFFQWSIMGRSVMPKRGKCNVQVRASVERGSLGFLGGIQVHRF